MFAYQSVKVGRAKIKFSFKPCLKGLFCWLINNHNSQTLKIQLQNRPIWSVSACCIICIIVLLERKVKGEA